MEARMTPDEAVKMLREALKKKVSDIVTTSTQRAEYHAALDSLEAEVDSLRNEVAVVPALVAEVERLNRIIETVQYLESKETR
jgi:prefoldin subunit 5